jgi:sulfonate transport system permease protein
MIAIEPDSGGLPMQKQIRDFLGLTLLSGIGIGMIKVSAPLYAKSMGADSAAIGFLTGVQPLGMMLMSVPAGLMISSVGSRSLYIIGSLIGALCFLLAPYATGLMWFFLLSAVSSLFLPFRFIPMQSDFFQHLLNWGNAKAGWLRAAQMGGAFVLGPILGGYLIGSVSFAATYFLIALSFLVSILLARNVLSGKEPQAQSASSTNIRKIGATMGALWSHGKLRQALATEFIVHMALIYFAIFIVIIAIDRFIFSEQAAAMLTGVQGGAFMLTLLFGGRLRLAPNQAGYQAVSYGITLSGLLILGLTYHGLWLWPGAVLLGVGLGLLTVANITQLTRLTTELGRGNVSGFSGLAGPGGGLVGSIGGGAIGQHIGLQFVFLILAGVFMLFSLIVLTKEAKTFPVLGRLQAPVFHGLTSWFKAMKHVGVALIVPVLILALWLLSSRNHWIAPQILPAPEKVAARLAELVATGDISRNLSVSFWRVVDGLAAGGAIGLLLGMAMGLSRGIEVYLNPLFKAFASVPSLAWVPLAILLVGIGEPLKVLLIAIACAVPITINTLEGIRNVPVNFIEVGRIYRFNTLQMLHKVILPSALPPIFSGVGLALNQAWQTLVAIELLASSEGIGFMMTWGRQLMQMDVVLATIVIISLVGLFLDKSLRLAEARLMRWRRP